MKKKRKNLTMNISKVYVFVSFIFIMGFVFFGTSKLFIAEEVPINQTELNTEFDLRASGKFSINSWIYDEEKNIMEVTIVTNGMKDYSSELDFSSISKSNLKQELPIETVFNDNEIYILHISKVPKNFEQVALRLHRSEKNMQDIFIEEDIDSKTNKKLVSTVYTDERKVDRGTIELKSNRSYLLQVTEDIITETNVKKEDINKKIEKVILLNEDLNNEIEDLKKDLLYETLDEQIDTNNKIYRLEREVESKEKDIDLMRQDIKNMDSKIERLKQKKRDISL